MGLAGLLTLIAAAVHVASYGPEQLGPPLMNIAFALFFAIFPVFGGAVAVLSFARIPVDRLYGGLPPYVYLVGGAVLLYVFVNFFRMVALLPDQAHQQSPLGQLYSARLFTGHELIFFGLSALMAYQIDGIRTGRVRLDVIARDEAIETHPLPAPLARIVALRTSLSPEECATRLLTTQPRSAPSLFYVTQGLRGQASATEFRLELASAQVQMVYAVGRFGRIGTSTGIRVLMTFKRWPLIVLAASALVLPLFLIFIAPGFPLSWEVILFVLAFGVGGNFLFGLDQRRRLLAQIKTATSATEIPPSDPEFALLN